jgi:archaellum component FlaC
MNEYTNLSRILNQLKDLVQRENQRHIMDMHLNVHDVAVLEEDVIPALESIVDYEPSDEELTGEPPISASEAHEAARKQHLAAHS